MYGVCRGSRDGKNTVRKVLAMDCGCGSSPITWKVKARHCCAPSLCSPAVMRIRSRQRSWRETTRQSAWTLAGYNCTVRIGGLCESDSTCHKDVLAEMLFEAMKVFNWRHAHSDCPTGEGESACTLHRIFTWSPMLYGRRLAILLQGIRNFAQTALSWSPTLC